MNLKDISRHTEKTINQTIKHLYTKSARFYDALYHFKNYKSASAKLKHYIQTHNPGAKTILDTACGTGKHIELVSEFYDAEGLDISEELLAIARERCPSVTFHKGDMIDFNIGKKFDVVTCLFSSIAYVKTFENLCKAVSCMTDHLNAKGLLLIEPWFSKETFWTDTITANHYDEKNLKISWMYTSKREDELSVLDINYLVGTPEEISYFKERHELGLFDDEQYRTAFKSAGLNVSFDKEGLFGRGIYIGIKN